MPPKMLERTTIALRPMRSATFPQTGAKIAPVSALIDRMIPAQAETAPGSCTPSCCTSSGMNGSAQLNAALLKA